MNNDFQRPVHVCPSTRAYWVFYLLLLRRAPVSDSLNLQRWTLSIFRIYIDEYAPGDNSVVLLASQPTLVRALIPY